MSLIRIGDSSTPPATYPAAADGWGFYIGGNTPHTWSPAEVAAAKLSVRYLLPIFTRSNPGAVSVTRDGASIVSACRGVGLPRGSLVAVDLEEAVDPTYVRALDDLVHAAGWLLAIYGQLSTVTRNPKPRGGYWVGDWDGVDEDPSWTGKQYRDAGPYDLSEFAADAPLWDTRPPAPAAATTGIKEIDMMIYKAKDSGAAHMLSGSLFWVISDASDLAAYIAAGVPQVTVDAAEIAKIQATVKATFGAAAA